MKVQITVEATIHKAMKETASLVYEKYGVVICNVDFDWNVIQAMSGERTAHLIDVSVTSKTYTS